MDYRDKRHLVTGVVYTSHVTECSWPSDGVYARCRLKAMFRPRCRLWESLL